MPYFLKLTIVCAILAFIVYRQSRLPKGYKRNSYPDHVNDAIQTITDNIDACRSGKDLSAAGNLINDFRGDYSHIQGIEQAVKDMEIKRQDRQDRLTINKLMMRNRNTKMIIN